MQVPDNAVQSKIFKDYDNFCKANQSFPVLFSRNNEEWACNEETLKHVVKLIEIMCKYLNGYPAAVRTQTLRSHIENCFISLYGLEHPKFNFHQMTSK